MKFLLIASHLGSGGTLLCHLLNHSLHVASVGRTNSIYKNAIAFYEAASTISERTGTPVAGGYYCDLLEFNFSFTDKHLYPQSKFVYLLREARPTLSFLVSQCGYSPFRADSYYRFRLRRLAEMASKTPDAVLLTLDDILSERAFPVLSEYLGVDVNVTNILPIQEEITDMPRDVVLRSEKAFARYMAHCKTLPLKSVSRCTY